ncbi:MULTISPECIES: RecX family transcriptional regulator [Acetobacter]|uniref:Regulatory protein RecX n=2 Tax=Acetobacter TaxID=434 RepID=A0AAN1U9J2_9PROT|nr:MULTISPECIES: RecX family transcriptional regulator [Acetobacter]ANA13293.1 recombinase RecA [Acetobacter oryzifermentans]ASL39695.1 recombinase RecA [Acetobacter oryzifermentans]AXN00878.1 recombinase RecA [Acetobacter pomorum]KAA8395679.1 RecX family transcriptional regulator [Acetobacter sp. DmW_125124]KAA8396581.1 RecX family transcriptional regulator [Acetobacter sp. DmW_125128]
MMHSGSFSSAHTSSGFPQLDRRVLREAALAHLARFGTTRHGLEQVLLRRIARWEKQALKAGADTEEVAEAVQALRPVVAEISEEMVRLGAVDDASFATSRARRLVRSGRSGRAVQAHLAARGVEADLRDAALQDAVEGFSPAQRELCAALVLARKRRMGPFATPYVADDEVESEQALARRHKALGVLARAGYARDVAEQVLDMSPAEAEDWMQRLRAES